MATAESALGAQSDVPITNQDVMKIFNRNKRNMSETVEELKANFGKINWGCKDKSISMKIHRLDLKVKQMKRNKQLNELESLMGSVFIPYADSMSCKFGELSSKLVNEVSSIISENNTLKRELYDLDMENENLEYDVQNAERKVDMLMNLLEITNKKLENMTTKRQEIVNLREQVEDWNAKYEELSNQFNRAVEQLHEAKQKLSKKCTRNLNKKIKRKENVIEKKNELLTVKNEEITNLKNENQRQEEQLQTLRQDKRNLLVKVCRLRKNKAEEYEMRIEDLKNEVKSKENEINELEKTIELLNDPNIQTYYEGKYSNEIRETIMTLVTECGVSQKKVNDVMQVVVKKLTGKTLDRLPSTGVKCRMLLEAKHIAQCQVATALLDSTNHTLHQDGTSKFHRHFQGFQFTTSNGTQLSSGLAEVATSDADSLLDEFCHLTSELGRCYSKSNDSSKTSSEIIASINSTMSDQCAVNPSFNKKFAAIRENVLPNVYENWENLSTEDKEQSTKLFSFFCKMHLFVNMASEVEKCINLFEKSVIADGRNPYSFSGCTESGCSRLIRTASKALTAHGCEKSGVGGHFSTYMKNKNIKNILTTFRGHRFNHLFHAAGTTFYHLTDIKDFLSNWSDRNDLLNSLYFDCHEIVFVGGVRALGLIDKLITGPLWRIIEAAPNSLALNNHLLQLKLTLEAWSKDASPALSGEGVFTEDTITKDSVYEVLTAPSEDPLLDLYTQMALEICCSGMLIIVERQAKDQLPGGKYWNLDQKDADILKHVPSTNTISERDFAQLDILMRTKPSASTTTYEAIVMWCNNKTSAWLSSLPETEKDILLEKARKNVPEMKALIKEKQQNLYRKKVAILQEKREKKISKEVKQHENKVKLTQKITSLGGLWTDCDIIKKFKAEHSTSDFKNALTTQIQFQKSVIQSVGPRELFQLQRHGKTYSVDELENNLKTILELNQNEEREDDQPVHLKYNNEMETHTKISNLKSTLRSKIEINREKVIISQQKELLPRYLKKPESLIGKNIKHKCKEEGSNTIEWVHGKVLGIKEHSHITKKIEYFVKYDDEDEDEWFFPLLCDLEKGDLIIKN